MNHYLKPPSTPVSRLQQSCLSETLCVLLHGRGALIRRHFDSGALLRSEFRLAVALSALACLEEQDAQGLADLDVRRRVRRCLSDKNRGNTCGLFSLRTQSALSLPPDHPSRVELLSELDTRCGRLAVRGRQNISREAEATAALEGSTGSLLNTPRLLPALLRPTLSHSLSLQLDGGGSTNVRNFEV